MESKSTWILNCKMSRTPFSEQDMRPTLSARGEGASGGPGGSGSRRAADRRTRESKRLGEITVGVVWGGMGFFVCIFSYLILKRRGLFLNSSVTQEGPEEKVSQSLPKRKRGPARRGTRRRPLQGPQAEPAAGWEREPGQGRRGSRKCMGGKAGRVSRVALGGARAAGGQDFSPRPLSACETPLARSHRRFVSALPD